MNDKIKELKDEILATVSGGVNSLDDTTLKELENITESNDLSEDEKVNQLRNFFNTHNLS